jgi:sulfur carrier protein
MRLEADPDARVSVIVNGEAVGTPARTLTDLLEQIGYGEARVATAINGEFVPQSRRRDIVLKDGDRVEIVAPRQGG